MAVVAQACCQMSQRLAAKKIRIADEPPPDGVASRQWLAKKRLRVKTRFWLMSRWFPRGQPR